MNIPGRKIFKTAACILAAAAVLCGCGENVTTEEACAEAAESINFGQYFAETLDVIVEEDEFTIQKDAFDMDACLQDLAENPDISEEMHAYFSANLKVYMEEDGPDRPNGPSYHELGTMTSVFEQDSTALVVWLHGAENYISILARKEYVLDLPEPEPEPIDLDEIPFSEIGELMMEADVYDVDFWVSYSGSAVSADENAPNVTYYGFYPVKVIYYENTQDEGNKLCFVFVYELEEMEETAHAVVTYENVGFKDGFLSMSKTDSSHMYDTIEFGYSDNYLEELRPELWKHCFLEFTPWG